MEFLVPNYKKALNWDGFGVRQNICKTSFFQKPYIYRENSKSSMVAISITAFNRFSIGLFFNEVDLVYKKTLVSVCVCLIRLLFDELFGIADSIKHNMLKYILFNNVRNNRSMHNWE